MQDFIDFLSSLTYIFRKSEKDKTTLVKAIEAAVQETWVLKKQHIHQANPYDIPNEDCKKVEKAWAKVISELRKLNDPAINVSVFEHKHEFWSKRELRQSIGVGDPDVARPKTLKQIEDILFEVKNLR